MPEEQKATDALKRKDSALWRLVLVDCHVLLGAETA